MQTQTTHSRNPAAPLSEVPMTALSSLALQMNLDPIQTIALPTVITVAAHKAGMAESAMVWEASQNAPLRDYLAGICREADVTGALQ